MRKLAAVGLAVSAAALAGAAVAATPKSHVMNVPLPDGLVARVEYAGDVAPKVTITPAPLSAGVWAPGAMPSFAGFDRMIAQMNRAAQAMVRQAHEMAARSGSPAMNVAGFGMLPAGTNSVSVISVSNGGESCTRTTEVVSQGAGKAPKVTSKVTGNCGAAVQSAPRSAPAATPGNRA